MTNERPRKWWRDDENILILNAGAVRMAVPKSWLVEGKAEGFGYLDIKDPTDSCALQISCIQIPPLVPDAPPIEQMLREVVQADHPAAALARAHTSTREETETAWMDYSYGEQDTERNEWRMAHARVLFATNRIVGALVTFYYWEDDTAWAVPAWERMVETIALGDEGLFGSNPRARRN